MVRFGSILGQLIFGQIRSSYQNKQLCRKFWVRYGSVPVNSCLGPLSGEHISGVESSMGPGRSIRISGKFC